MNVSSPPAFRYTREIMAWSLYDFANSAFATMILTVAFSVFFKETVCGGGGRGDYFWGLSFSIANVITALFSPPLGAFCDETGRRKHFLIAMTLICVACTACMTFLGPGMIARGMILFILAFFGFAAGNVFYNAFLPELGPAGHIGKISGFGWALGYAGGLASLVLFYPWLSGDRLPATFLLTAVFFLVFSVPAFVWLKAPQQPAAASLRQSLLNSLRRLNQTRRSFFKHGPFFKFLLSYFFFNDGINTIVVFAAVYARQTLGMTMGGVTILFIALQVTSFIGAYVSGFFVDRIGAERTIFWTLILWIVVVSGVFAATSQAVFWFVALAGGLGIGSTQAASRSFVALMTPREKVAEFFGFYAVFTKFSSILGPYIFGLISKETGSQRMAVLSVLAFFVVGAILLARMGTGKSRPGISP